MFRLNTIKQNVLILSFATLLAGCGGGGTTTTTDSTSTDFTTTSTPKRVQIEISAIATEDSATITWTPYGYTTKSVEYGTSNKYGSQVVVQEEGTVTLYNLQANTEYHYRIVSEDEKGRPVVSSDMTFTTLAVSTQPIVTEPAPTEPVVTEPGLTPEPVLVEANNPPEAQEVMIVGIPKVGETLTLDYTFIDADGDTEGDSIIAWSTPTKEVQRSTSKTFTIPEELAGMQLSAWVHLSDGKVVNEVGIQASNGYITIEETLIVNTIPESTPESQPEPASVCASGPAMQQGQVTDSLSGESLSGVIVTINGCITQTDAQGFYELNNIAVSERAVITFKLDGYYINSEIIAIKEYADGTTLSPNYLEFSLDKYDEQNNDDSQNEKTWSSNFGINIPAGIYTDNAGNTYSGNVTAQVAYEDVATEKGREVFPGAYEGKNSNGMTVPFVSYGFMVVDLKDESGNALSISADITLTFHTAIGTTADIVPLWYYDHVQGIWIEEGYATRLADGKYEGTISHPGTWSLSEPVEEALGIYADRILYPDGTPVKNLHIHAIGDNWIRTDLSTDENGEFEIKVIPGKSFTLKAYHSTDKYSATYNGTISAVASGEIINNSSL